MRRAAMACLAAAAVLALIAGCSSSAKPAASGKVQTGAGGPDVLPASEAAGSAASARTVRLGFVTEVQDGIALVGLQQQLFTDDLGAGVDLDPVPYSSSAAEAPELAAGRLDAAYLDPVVAVQVWQATHGGVRIIAGASSTGGASAAVLVVTNKFLAAHPGEVQGLLKGQVEAAQMLTEKPASGDAAVGAELTALGDGLTARKLADELTAVRFTDDPLASSVSAEVGRAVAAGKLSHVTSLSSIYDIAPLNKLARAAGLQPVSV
jgi:ABC-type nitrate/sulfonate/bicarbonate transport system substrate-binding protein